MKSVSLTITILVFFTLCSFMLYAQANGGGLPEPACSVPCPYPGPLDSVGLATDQPILISPSSWRAIPLTLFIENPIWGFTFKMQLDEDVIPSSGEAQYYPTPYLQTQGNACAWAYSQDVYYDQAARELRGIVQYTGTVCGSTPLLVYLPIRKDLEPYQIIHFQLTQVTYTRGYKSGDSLRYTNENVTRLSSGLLLAVVTPFVQGDTDGDSVLTGADIAMQVGAVMGRIKLSALQILRSDVNGDGGVDSYETYLNSSLFVGRKTCLPVNLFCGAPFVSSVPMAMQLQAGTDGLELVPQAEVTNGDFVITVPPGAQVALTDKVTGGVTEVEPGKFKVSFYSSSLEPLHGAVLKVSTSNLHITGAVNNGQGVYFNPDSPTGVGSLPAKVPTSFKLEQNYPNPFNPSTTIEYALPAATTVRLTVYNTLGEEVRVLVNERQDAGVHTMVFQGNDLPSGVYMYRLVAGEFTKTNMMILVK